MRKIVAITSLVALAGVASASLVYENTFETLPANDGNGSITAVAGQVGNAADFTGDAWHNAGNVAPSGAAARTFSVWINPDSDAEAQGDNKFFGYGAASAGLGFDISYEGGAQGNGIFLREWGGALRWDATGLAGSWTHIAVRVNDSASTFGDVDVFIDGVLQSVGAEYGDALTDTINTTASDLYIGSATTGTGAALSYNGGIDEFQVYDTALTNGEIAALAAIPEPATLGLVAVFGGGVLFVRRKLMM